MHDDEAIDAIGGSSMVLALTEKTRGGRTKQRKSKKKKKKKISCEKRSDASGTDCKASAAGGKIGFVLAANAIGSSIA